MLQIDQYIKNHRGQSMVEFAIVLPVFLLLVFGMMEFGRVMNQYLVVAEAAREGARSAALGGNDGTVTTTVKAAATTIDEGQLTVSIFPAVRVRGNSVTVTVTNKMQIITPVISAIIANPYTVQGKTIMRVE